MPRRTNDFQKLVFMVRTNLAAGAAVEESAILEDRCTKRGREVDVVIRGEVGGLPVLISIECRDHKRIADVSWIDAMKAKHERLPTQRLLLASCGGFTPEARAVAACYGIEIFSLSEVDHIDFPKLFGIASTLWLRTATVSCECVRIQMVPADDQLPGEALLVIPDTLLYTCNGNEICSIGNAVQVLLKSASARDLLLGNAGLDDKWFEMDWVQPKDPHGNPFCLRKAVSEELRDIALITIKGPCEIAMQEFGMRRGLLGDVQVAWGKVNVCGLDALVAATRNNGGEEKLSVSFSKKPHLN